MAIRTCGEQNFAWCRKTLKVGSIQLRNRVVLPAHSYGFAPTRVGGKRLLAYVERRLRAGVSAVIIGETDVRLAQIRVRNGRATSWERTRAELYQNLAVASGNYGGWVFEQLFHPGGQVWYEEGTPAFAPSVVPQQRPYLVPLELDRAGIREIRRAFVEAARLAISNGIRGVEIKADQGKLHHQFLSRMFNHRSDEYGGQLQQRSRFLLECLEEIRACVGSEAVLGVRLAGSVTPPSGAGPKGDWCNDLSLAETIDVVAMLSGAGLVDYISISGETNSSMWGYWQNHGNEYIRPMTFREVAHSIKKTTELPIILSGRIVSLTQAEEVLKSNDCDAVGMVRALIADGELLVKSEVFPAASQNEPVRPCIGCNISCVGSTWYGKEVRCIYDPLTGRESEFAYRTRKEPLKIAVVGAGPAGLEFSRTAAMLGNSVTLFEERNHIGGLLRYWAKLPGRQNIDQAVQYWEKIVTSDPRISLRIGTSISALEPLCDEFTFVIVAVGGVDVLPQYELLNTPIRNLSAIAAIAENGTWVGRNSIVVDANRYSDPLGVAALLLDRGSSVSIVCPYDEVGMGLDPVSLASRLARLKLSGVNIMRWSDVRPMKDGSARILDQSTNMITRVEAVTDLVWCVNRHPKSFNSDNRRQGKVFKVGDAYWPRGLEKTVKDAHDLAVKLSANQHRQCPASPK